MKSIVRKRLVALLSLAGFAGSTGAVTAQVVKGSEPTTSKTKYSKTQGENKEAVGAGMSKLEKNSAENKVAAGAGKSKLEKNGATQYPIEHGKEKSLTTTKSDTHRKQHKKTVEGNAAKGGSKVNGTKNSSSNGRQNASGAPQK